MRTVTKYCFDKNDFPTKYTEFQKFYLNPKTRRLIPNIELWEEGQKILEINSLGCKGNEPNLTLPTIGVFGDSTTFCVGNDSWAQRIQIPGTQVINAGIEGANLDMVTERYHELAQSIKFTAIVVYTGWHNIIYNQRTEEYWSRKLNEFKGDHLLIFCTLATSLHEDSREKGIQSHLNADNKIQSYLDLIKTCNHEKYYLFWGNLEPSHENICKILDGVHRYNQFLKNYCIKNNYLLLDFHTLLKPLSHHFLCKDFFDVCHFRPKSYSTLSQYAQDSIKGPLSTLLPSLHTETGQKEPKTSLAESHTQEDSDLAKHIYTLW